MIRAGSLVFTPPRHPVDLRDWSQWWTFKFGANWRRPYGPRSSLAGLHDHPVIHIAYWDVEADAGWAGKGLPTEAEREFAARDGLEGAEFAWGDESTTGGRQTANTWQGAFPLENLNIDGYERTSPVGSFPAKGDGLHEMIGNSGNGRLIDIRPRTRPLHRARAVFRRTRTAAARTRVTIPASRRSGSPARCLKAARTSAPPYCRRYRPAARHAQPVDTSMSHVGFLRHPQ